ncbi:hypothetical protein Tco_0664765 [Tanacetum coccineum]
MACDVSWRSSLSKLNDENVLLKTQVDSVVQEKENIKLVYQNLFNSIKATRAQHQQEVNELIESINQKTYAYGDVRSKIQDLLMVIYDLKDKLKTLEKGKGANTKFDKSVTSGKLLCVTPLPNNIAVQAKKVLTPEDKTDRSKPVTSHSTPKNKQKQKNNANVIARGMYKIPKQESQTCASKSYVNVYNSTRVESSTSVRRPPSKDVKLKNRVLKNTNDKSSSTHVRKVSSGVRIDSNKHETINSTVCQSNASVLNTKTVNAAYDSLNIVCVSCGKDVFMLSHEKCVARYALSSDTKVKRALFTIPVAAKSKNLGATSVVAKSRLSVAKTPTATNKVFSVLSISSDSSQSRTLSLDMKNKIATSRKWQKWFKYQPCFNWIPKSKTIQSTPSVSKSSTSVRKKSKTPVTTQKWEAKLSTLPYAFVSCDAGTILFGNDHFAAITGYGDYVQGSLTICHVYYVEGLGHILFSVGKFYDGDLEVAFRSSTCYVQNLEGDDLLTGSRESNLYTISISDLAASSPV